MAPEGIGPPAAGVEPGCSHVETDVTMQDPTALEQHGSMERPAGAPREHDVAGDRRFRHELAPGVALGDDRPANLVHLIGGIGWELEAEALAIDQTDQAPAVDRRPLAPAKLIAQPEIPGRVDRPAPSQLNWR